MSQVRTRWLRIIRHSNTRSRFYSQKSSSPPTSSGQIPFPGSTSSGSDQLVQKAQQQQQTRLDRLLKRTPKFLHRHISSLRSAPVTHISAFLILHEITAVVPLLGLAGAFHYYNWLPTYFSEGAWIVSGVEKFGRYFRRKGWISRDDEEEAERLAESGDAQEVEKKKKFNSGRWWDRGEGSVRIVVEFATAYAIVKALLIPRLMLSAWGAPWFARWTVIPAANGVKRLFKRTKPPVQKVSP